MPGGQDGALTTRVAREPDKRWKCTYKNYMRLDMVYVPHVPGPSDLRTAKHYQSLGPRVWATADSHPLVGRAGRGSAGVLLRGNLRLPVA